MERHTSGGIARVKRIAVAACACAALGGALPLLGGCAAGVAAGIAQSLVINYGPDMFASMFGTYETRMEFRETVPLIRKRDWLGLTILARQKLDKEPNRGEWWQIAGYGHLQMGEIAVARDCFARTVKLMPEEAGAWNLYAYTLNQLGDRRGALGAVNRSIEADPSSNTAFVILGDLHRDAGRLRESRQAYEHAIGLDNQDVFAWYGLGLLGKRSNMPELYQRARDSLKKLYPPMLEQLEKA